MSSAPGHTNASGSSVGRMVMPLLHNTCTTDMSGVQTERTNVGYSNPLVVIHRKVV